MKQMNMSVKHAIRDEILQLFIPDLLVVYREIIERRRHDMIPKWETISSGNDLTKDHFTEFRLHDQRASSSV